MCTCVCKCVCTSFNFTAACITQNRQARTCLHTDAQAPHPPLLQAAQLMGDAGRGVENCTSMLSGVAKGHITGPLAFVVCLTA